MSYFVVLFLALASVVLILAPLVLRLTTDVRQLSACLKQAQQEVAETLRKAEYFRLACEHAPDGILIQDMNGRIVWANAAYGRIHGRDFDSLLGRNPLEFATKDCDRPSPDTIAAFRYDPHDPAYEKLQLFENQRADGTLFWNQVSVSFRRSPTGQENAVQVCRDVTEQVQQENHLRDVRMRLEHEATHDQLTSVPNRAAFLKFMETALHDPKDAPVGLLHIDLDNFKVVNDTHGHSAGDAVLVHVAKTVRDAIQPDDMTARVGGDEFVVVCREAVTLASLRALSEEIIENLTEPFNWTNGFLNIEASIGAAVSDATIKTAEDLLLNADFALYEAKRAGRGQVVSYDQNLRSHHLAQLKRAAELETTIDTDGFDYHFQPTLNLNTGEVCGMETLVRWHHPDHGIIPPDDFLPMVKDLGLMGALDLLSMSAALAEKRRLNQKGYEHLGIAFNASPELLGHPDFINRLVWGVEAAGIDRAQVTIEVLETTDFGDALETSSHAAIIRDLRAAGFHVHLDDFGIGFAGLSHLATLDVSGVKIDRGLIMVLLTDPASRKIVRKIIELSNDLGLTVIAEGVEDLHTANTLRAMGCGIIQGYWLSKPLPTDQLHQWLIDEDVQPSAHQA